MTPVKIDVTGSRGDQPWEPSSKGLRIPVQSAPPPSSLSSLSFPSLFFPSAVRFLSHLSPPDVAAHHRPSSERLPLAKLPAPAKATARQYPPSVDRYPHLSSPLLPFVFA